jgi:phenylacetate-CoA ligase
MSAREPSRLAGSTMSLVQNIYRRVVIPAFEDVYKGRQIFRLWRELERTQWLARSELEELQFQALGRLLREAFAHCPYYRKDWISRGLDPRMLKSPDDFHRWPITSRETIRANRIEMRSVASGVKLISKTTGGSTGAPLQFDIDPGSYEHRNAAYFRGYNLAGAGPGTKQLFLWGVPLESRNLRKRVKDSLYNRVYRRKALNTFELGGDRIAEFVSVLKRFRPDTIVAYAQSMYVFARLIAAAGIHAPAPGSIVVGAEKLHRFQRETIESVFGAPVFETYGSREFMLMGAECDRHAGLHLTMENILLEVLDDDGAPTPAGEVGNVVVTDLYNRGMPFIRYLNGDQAVAGFPTCACGRGLPLLREVAGRRADILVTPDGRHLTGLAFPHLLKEFPAVTFYRVIQENPEFVRIELVVNPSWTQESGLRIQTAAQSLLGPMMRVQLQLVDCIPPGASGKRQVVINRCAGELNAPSPWPVIV